MRRCVCLVLVLVVVLLASLAYARIASTPAFAARVGFARLQPGMAQSEVRRLMGTMSAEASSMSSSGDLCIFAGKYWITVEYDSAEAGSAARVLKSKSLYQMGKADSTDSFLEFLGFPKVDSISYG